MNSLGIMLLWCMLQVTLLAAAAGLCYAVARRFGPASGSLAALSGLVGVVCLTALSFAPFPRWDLFGAAQADNPAQPATAAAAGAAKNVADGEPLVPKRDAASAPITNDNVVWSEADKNDIRTRADSIWNSFLSALATPAVAAPAATQRWPMILGIVFGALILVGLARLVIGLVVVRSYYRRSEAVSEPRILGVLDVLQAALSCRRAIELRESAEVATAATIGWRKPVILLPGDWRAWTEPECHAVLAHEVAHIQRNDFVAWVCAQTGLALHFYHPLVHWLAGRLRLEQELAADAAAASVAGGQRSYLMTLAEMALRQSDRPLAWPARTFLPTRGTFLRRIEMLRDHNLLPTATSVGTKFVLVTAVLLTGLFAAGLRGPEAVGGNAALANAPAESEPAAEAQRQRAQAEQNVQTQAAALQAAKEPLSVAWVPRDAVVVAAIRPARLLAAPLMSSIRGPLEQLQEAAVKQFGASIDHIEQVTVFILAHDEGARWHVAEPVAVVRLDAATQADAMLKALFPNMQEQEFGGRKIVQDEKQPTHFAFRADERTLVLATDVGHMRRVIVGGPANAAKAGWWDDWKSVELADAAVLVNVEQIRGPLNQELARGPALPGPMMTLAPLLSDANTATLALQVGNQLSMRAAISSGSAENAQKVKDTVSAVVTLAKNAVSQGRAEASRLANAKESALLLGSLEIVEDLLNSVKVEQRDAHVTATARIDSDAAERLIALTLPAITQARAAARRAQAMNNLKQIALAMHNYVSTHKTFPPAVLYGPDGKTPYSWRVALLPYLEQESLFRQYNFNEPWDSETNKKVLAKMPLVYRDPGDPEDTQSPSYFALTGPTTVFSGRVGTGIVKITDGTSNTLMIVEAQRDIPWTKPEDIPYAADKPVPKLGGHFPDIFLGAMCDGSVRAIAQTIDEKVLRGLITKDGGERVFDPVQETVR
jgi:beta-lactamase regulating signal transducer with metallopeptidase domain/type II secretory pathway pseudopilin PulG